MHHVLFMFVECGRKPGIITIAAFLTTLNQSNHMDISSKFSFPAGALSNLAAHPFVFDGIECASMEGLLQSFKYDDLQLQIDVCKLAGRAAQSKGQDRNDAWKSCQTLWWQGQAFSRRGEEYQQLVTRAYNALNENESFRKALSATGDEGLTHSIGKSDPSDTILTEREFCDQLLRLRAILSE